MSSPEPLISIEEATKTFRSRHGRTTALDGVSLELRAGDRLALVGESGSGKTTLGRVLAGLEHLDSGTVKFGGHDISRWRAADLRRYRRELQIVFQNGVGVFNPWQTTRRILEEPLRIQRIAASEREGRISDAIRSVGLSDAILDRRPAQCSNGQRQRISIARALVLRPSVLIADEVTSALDVSIQAQVLNLLADLSDSRGLTLIFITHDLRAAYFLCPRIAVMMRGRMVETGSREQIWNEPRADYTRDLIGAIPQFAPSDPAIEAH